MRIILCDLSSKRGRSLNGDLTEADRHERLSCAKQSLNVVIFTRFADEKIATLLTLVTLEKNC